MFLMIFQTAVGIEAILRVGTLAISQKFVRAHACTLTSLPACFLVIFPRPDWAVSLGNEIVIGDQEGMSFKGRTGHVEGCADTNASQGRHGLGQGP
jgi:hypothetical protein